VAQVLFVQHVYYPYQSVMRLSAYLKHRGHKAELIIGDDKQIVNHIKKAEPDLIAFSVLTPDRNRMLSAVGEIKKAGITSPVIAGGYDITFLPELLEYSPLDIVCRGEGEEPLSELCDRIDGKEDYTHVQNLWVKENKHIHRNQMRTWILDRDGLPFDDRDIYWKYDPFFKLIPFTSVMAGRGCPHRCSYCFNHKYKEIYRSEGSTGFCRLRTVDNLIEELLMLKQKYKAKYLFFNDSTLTYNKKWLLEFLEKYRELVSLPFSFNAVISEVDDEIARALGENGYCYLVRFGLESGNEDLRVEVLKKNVTQEQLIQGVRSLRKYRIRYSMTIMMALPGETLASAWETIETAGKLISRGNICSIAVFQAYPGLEITEYGVKAGQYKKEDVAADAQLETIKEFTRRIVEGKTAPVAPGRGYGTSGPAARLQFGTETYRVDPEGERIKRLFRFSHIAIRVPCLRPFIKLLIRLPDNVVFRFVFQITQLFFATRTTARASYGFLLRYVLFHYRKRLF
jgi:anaerobic magnesium-protoporphyrin IX monomethyl ester cyclase